MSESSKDNDRTAKNNGRQGRNRRGGNRNNNKNNKGHANGDNNDKEGVPRNSGTSSTSNKKADAKKQQRDPTGGKNTSSNINNNSSRGKGNHKRNRNNSTGDIKYANHWSLSKCLQLYVDKDPNIIRGKLRVLPAKDGMAFCTCDRGSQRRDVVVETDFHRNRAMNGDIVFIELLPPDEEQGQSDNTRQRDDNQEEAVDQKLQSLHLDDGNEGVHAVEEEEEMWQEDEIQMNLWNPIVPIRRIRTISKSTDQNDDNVANGSAGSQRKGRVVHVCLPTTTHDGNHRDPNIPDPPSRIMIGTLKSLQSGTILFTPNDRVLPQFKCNKNCIRWRPNNANEDDRQASDEGSALYKAEYIYHSWNVTQKWPPCNVSYLGEAFSIEDQIQGLLMENQVDHGEFSPEVLKDVQDAVQSGVYLMSSDEGGEASAAPNKGMQLGWKPTPEMYKGRRDYREERIFTIDPTTAKDLDDALHIKLLPDGCIELGVHIADVSAFVHENSDVDREARRRATTVYLVDRTVPMLPRPLCEVACSLNENVERLAFSCVWKMNMDGTLAGGSKKRRSKQSAAESSQDVWYGRTVIRSCARLDYGTAQNIIENKVATGEKEGGMDEELWPKARRPTGGHTIADVATDVRLMHKVAMARRKLRFANGALALHGVKLTFRLDDTKQPMKCAPYPIKDSNRLVEEFMLLANYLVAERLITHAGNRAVLRRHPDPLPLGLEKVVDVAKAMFDFDVDASSSASLQSSLKHLEAQCKDEVTMQCVTQMLTTPMQNADYFSAGSFEMPLWRHFALNIPYYTHFTSPIRRYADVMVHRLLQATIDGSEAVEKHPLGHVEINDICEHCNEKRLASKSAQERCDRVFLALYLRRNPMKSELGVVLSLGKKALTVYVPSIGVSTMMYMDEHKEWLEFSSHGDEEHNRRIVVERKVSSGAGGSKMKWSRLDIRVFSKLCVSCLYKDQPKVDVKLSLEGPWTRN